MPDETQTHGRDLVVIGASAGGLEVLSRLLSQLPARLPAVVLIVMHLGNSIVSQLDVVLARKSKLPVRWAKHDDVLTPGQVLLAPQGVHCLVVDNRVVLQSGPLENHVRPSINRLFRSAAVMGCGRTIGVLLTGMLDDGVAGLVALRRCGGIVLVQDPADAPFPDMPRNAIAALVPDETLPISALGEAIARYVCGPRGATTVPEDVGLEASLDLRGPADPYVLSSLGAPAFVACPECAGPTWLVGSDTHRGYRCFLGHTASGRVVFADKTLEAERALWTTLRALHERAVILTDLANEIRARGETHRAHEYESQSADARSHAVRVHHLLMELQQSA